MLASLINSAKEIVFYPAFVCLLATLRKNYWLDFLENFARDALVDKAELINF